MQRRQQVVPRPGDVKGEDGEWIKSERIAGTKNEMGVGSFSRGAATRRHMAIEEYAVDWNGPATEPPPRLRLLLLTDVDLASAKRVVEWALQGERAFDLCAVCGDFVPRPEGWSTAGETEEKLSAEEGEMSATLAQLENTVCRVVYVPGPLDPVMPSIRLSRAQNNVGAAAAGTEQGLLQLTPTSKNVHRRNLRLAPGLSVAGFTEEPNLTISSSSFRSSRNRDSRVVGLGGKDKFADDETFSTLRSLCRSGGRSRNRNNNGAPVNRSSPGAAAAAAAALTARRKVAAPPESVILMTRLGGAQRRRRRSASGGGADSDSNSSISRATTAATAAADEAALKSLDELNLTGAVPLRPPYCSRAAVTAARLRHLWATQQGGGAAATTGNATADGDDSAPEGGGIGGLEGRGGGVLLHVCAGPGAFLAVGEALSEGAAGLDQQERQHEGRHGGGVFASPIPQGVREEEEGPAAGECAADDDDGPPGSSEAAGDESSRSGSGSAGIACEIGGCTVAALGSLRDHGAYCVVELAMPTRRHRGDAAIVSASGWSVADVQFGRVDGGDGEREEAKRRLARSAAGNFVLNYA